MSLPIERILWAGNRPSDHDNHLHVEAKPPATGTPPLTRPPMTTSLIVIYDALSVEFGTPYYFHNPTPPAPNWSHMGWYNRRYIAGSSTWSQHAYSNALDIGPYYGAAAQQKYYDYLTGANDMTGPNGEPNWDKVSDWAKPAWTEAYEAGLLSDTSDPKDTVEVEQLMVYFKRAKII